MARRLADDGDSGTSRRSVADLLREAGIEDTGPRRRRRFIEEEDEDEPAIGSTSDDVPVPDPDAAPRPATEEVPESDPVSEAEPPPNAEPDPGDDDRPDSSDSADSSDSSDSPDSADSSEQEDERDADGPGDETGASGQVDDEPAGVPDELRNSEAATAVMAKPAREHSGAVHWTLAIGEVILAIAIGVGLSFVFRLLWDIAPYAAAVLAPVVICAVVAVVGFSRKKMGLGSIPLNLLLLVLFVTALLVVIPAALVLTAP